MSTKRIDALRAVAVVLFTGLALAGMSTSVAAHHAFAAEFDQNKPVVLKGTVTKMEWLNPHCWLHLDVAGSDGKVVSWAVEGGAPNALLRRGFSRTSVPVGAQIVVEGFRAVDGSNRANGRELTLADGKKLFMGSSGTGAPKDGLDPTDRR